MMKKLIVYVDGFNLYFGMVEAGFSQLKWLDVRALAEVLKENGKHQIVEVKYFTSRISTNASKQKRQTTYLEALQTTDLTMIYGKFQSNTMKCNTCGCTWIEHKEKMTDVNIATEMMADAYSDRFDTAILISADSDLVPPVRSILKLFPRKEVIIAFPPNRTSNDLKAAASKSFTIGKAKLFAAQLPDRLTSTSGYLLRKPAEWQ